jgi:hypothetical protein
MKVLLMLIMLAGLTFSCFSQTRDISHWIDFGGNHVNKWLQIAPGKLGPNALPVPDMDYALVGSMNKAEVGAHYHIMPGDTALNSYFSFYWDIAPGRAAIEIWGQPTETFRLSDKLRDERQIYYDDTGWITQAGDLFISTYVQLIDEQKYLPAFSLNYTLKTTTGSNMHGRYTDATMNYFYLAAGKSFYFKKGVLDEIRVAGLFGFYVWQTNKTEMAQDEGPVFEGGIQFRKKSISLYFEFGGYSGYDAYNYSLNKVAHLNVKGYNDPLIMRARFEKTGKHFDFTVEYQAGFRDYPYYTFKVGTIYRFEPRRFK